MNGPRSAVEAKYDIELLDRLFAITGANPDKKGHFDCVIWHWAGLNDSFLRESKRCPSFKSIESNLKRVRDLASELLPLIRDENVGCELWRAADPLSNPPLAGFDWVRRAEDEIEKLIGWARDARIAAAKKKAGPQQHKSFNEVRQDAVDELGHIWLCFAGKLPTRRTENPATSAQARAYGPFRYFVDLAMPPVFGGDARKGIDRYIRETCTRMNKTPPPKTPSFIHTP
jgi:hypothetical protein